MRSIRSTIRIFTLTLGALLIWLIAANGALAQADAWPTITEPFTRGPGYYLSGAKIAMCWLLFLVWIRTTTWIHGECQFYHLDPETWIPVVCVPFVAALLLFFVLPSFWVGFLLMVLAYVAPLVAYIRERNKNANPDQRIDLDILNDLVVRTAARVGIQFASGSTADTGAARSLRLAVTGRPTPVTVQQGPGFSLAQELISGALDYGATGVLLEHSPETTVVCYQIDGVWYRAEAIDPKQGDAILGSLKTLAGLKPTEHRARQQGELTAQDDSGGDEPIELKCHFTCQGTPAGERAIVRVEPVQFPFASLDDLGLRPQLQEQLKQVVAQTSGFVLFSAPPGHGLTTTVDQLVNSCDRLTRDFAAIEEKGHREREIESVSVVTYSAAASESPAAALKAVLATQPNVLVVRDLVNAATVNALCEQTTKDRLVLGTVLANDAAEALLRVLALRVPPQTFAGAVVAVTNQRLVRKLCPTCKQAYTPSPEVLKSLGLAGARLKELFNPPQEIDIEKVCPDCHGIGYKGRTAIMELMIVDDEIQQTLAHTPKIDALRAAARSAGMRTLHEEGVWLVTRGVTSVAELKRVLRQ